MATTSSQGGARTPSRTTTARRGTTKTRTTAARSTTTATTPKTPIEQAQALAERVVNVPVGASLLARDNFVASVKSLTTKYSTRAGVERELKRFERRGATARNRFERQVRRARTRFERQVRQRRSLIERTVKQNRRQVERQVKTVRKDLGKQSDLVGKRAQKLVSDAQGLLNSRS
jgi:hypothetical protein